MEDWPFFQRCSSEESNTEDSYGLATRYTSLDTMKVRMRGRDRLLLFVLRSRRLRCSYGLVACFSVLRI